MDTGARKLYAPPAQAALHDDELMVLARNGQRNAFEVLVTRHQQRALRVAARYLGDPAAARDVAQNTFLELYHCLARYQPRGKLTAYLYRIVINQCHMAARSRRRTLSLDPAYAERATGANAALLCLERRDLEVALTKLSSKLRIIVILRYSEDLDLAEIAELLTLPLGTVKRRLFDAMAKLRQLLEEGT